MYLLQNGSETTEFPTRQDAITAAKALSVEARQIIVVTDEEQRERLAYQNGELESYTYETRGMKSGH